MARLGEVSKLIAAAVSLAFGNERTDVDEGEKGRKESMPRRGGVSVDFTLLSTLQTIRLGHCRRVATKAISPPACIGNLAEDGRVHEEGRIQA